jgi:hypothetical protein
MVSAEGLESKELQPLLEDFHLVGDETAEDYTNLFVAVAMAAKPAGTIDWLYIKEVADLTWDIRRERAIKAAIIELKRKEVVLDQGAVDDPVSVGSHLYRILGAAGEVMRWSVDPEAKKEINAKLTARGYPPSEVLAQVYMRGAAQIDAVDRRIASCEMRKMAIFREIERRNERLSRQLEKASAEIIDAEFSEAANNVGDVRQENLVKSKERTKKFGSKIRRGQQPRGSKRFASRSPVSAIAALRSDLETLALSIARAAGKPTAIEFFEQAAEALELFRIRKVRATLLSGNISDEELNKAACQAGAL